MLLRVFTLMLISTASLQANQESKDFLNMITKPKNACVNSYDNNCRTKPSEAELLSQMQAVIDTNMLLSPLLQPQGILMKKI